MNKLSNKSVLLFAAVMATCALVPSMASAASWSAIGSHHVFDSANAGFFIDANATDWRCGEIALTARVANAMDLEITSASFTRCTAFGPAIGTCTQTTTATNLPWTATATTSTLIDIRNIHAAIVLENEPGNTACTAAGLPITMTGNLANGHWSNTSRHLTLSQTRGLVWHSVLGSAPVTAFGTFRDTQQTLQVLP